MLGLRQTTRSATSMVFAQRFRQRLESGGFHNTNTEMPHGGRCASIRLQTTVACTAGVPQGTRVIGQYDNNVQSGHKRVLLVCNRLIFPNGRSIPLERQPGADADATPACRTVSTITGGISRRLRVFPRSSALARSLRFTMMIVRFVLSATAAKTRSTMLANRSPADN